MAFAVFGWSLGGPALAELICADGVVPAGMAVTATGTTSACAGACRARETQAVCGPVMKICAGQPIPKGYVVDSITTMPACQCLGPEDNAYVIQYVATRNESSLSRDTDASSADLPYVDSDDKYALDNEDATKVSRKARYPYGDPPFGNLLCATNATERERSGNSSPGQTNDINMNGFQPPMGSLSEQPALPPALDYQASPHSGDYPASRPSWDYQRNEPFREGQ